MPLRRLLPLSLLLIACVVFLAACGASIKSSSPATTTSTTTTAPSGGAASSSAFAKFADCLKQHGVTPQGGAGGGPPQGGGTRPQLSATDRAKFQAAQTACANLRPAGAGGGFQRGGGNSSAFAAYTNCLKLHGVTLTPGQRPDATSKKVQTAMAACASLRPSGGAGTTPPTSN